MHEGGARFGWGLFVGAVVLVGAGCGSSTGSHGPGLATGNGDGGTPDGGTGVAIVPVTQTDLVSDNAAKGTRTDPNLVNPWGIARGPQSPFWISDNGTGKSSVFGPDGNDLLPAVTIPAPPGAGAGATSAPTGVTFNGALSSSSGAFQGDTFLFATEDGTIAGWQQGSGARAVIRVDNSASGAVYKGLAIVGATLYAANFNSGKIDTWDGTFAAKGSITDPNVPAGFAPFNVANINDKLFVTFALQDQQKKDDVPGAGNGFVDVFDPAANTFTRLVSQGPLNSPWGMALAPSDFGRASGMLLVGNFGAGDNHINVFDPTNGTQMGQLTKSDGTPITIEGLWGLAFGNDAAAGPHNTLFFTAGPGDEQHGLFGKLVAQ